MNESKLNLKNIDPSVVELMLFLYEHGPSKVEDIIKGIKNFHLHTLGKAGDLQIIDHSIPIVWLTSYGEKIVMANEHE